MRVRLTRFYRNWRLNRCERLLARQRAGARYLTSWEARFIEKLFPQELRDLREAQAERRWRNDAIASLDAEVRRLRGLLFPELELKFPPKDFPAAEAEVD